MAELFDAAQQASGQDIHMWKGAIGRSEFDFRWELYGTDPDALREAFDSIKGDRATVVLLDELAGHGWDGRHRDELSRLIEGHTALGTHRIGDLMDEREVTPNGSDQVAGSRWLQQMCSIANDLIGPTDVLVERLWADKPSLNLMRTASDMQTLIEADIRCGESGAWRETRRGAQRHLRLDSAHRTLWRRTR
jgi:hypothetical protein